MFMIVFLAIVILVCAAVIGVLFAKEYDPISILGWVAAACFAAGNMMHYIAQYLAKINVT